MKNYNDYIGKTFKGFKFEDEEHSGLSYNSKMNKSIGEDLKIEEYDENDNSFLTDSSWCYPAELVIAQLEKQETEIETFKPKRGDRVLFSDSNEEGGAELIFLCEIYGALYPYFSVSKETEKDFIDGNEFNIVKWRYMKPLPQKVIPKDTLVWVKNTETSLWVQRFYSNFENGKHYCFLDQKKSNQTTDTTSWEIVTDKNPFE
jgi:hypothetical protein